jgi:hypothetical protein
MRGVAADSPSRLFKDGGDGRGRSASGRIIVAIGDRIAVHGNLPAVPLKVDCRLSTRTAMSRWRILLGDRSTPPAFPPYLSKGILR